MNKSIAICMRGGVSIYSKRTLFKSNGHLILPEDIYKNKNYVNIYATFLSIKKHIINVNPDFKFDFFLHGWNQDLQDVLVNIYNPKSYQFEDNNIYKKDILKKCVSPECFSGPSQLLSMKKSIELKETYEKENHFIYDMVILYRYDVLLWKDMVLSSYDVKNNIWCSPFYLPYHVGDFHIIMSTPNAFLFKKCYDWVSDYHSNPHRLIYKYITNVLGLSVKTDSIFPVLEQDVIRKMHPHTIKYMRRFGINKRDVEESQINTHLYFIYTIPITIFLSFLLYIRHRKKILSVLYYFIYLSVVAFFLYYIMNVVEVIYILLCMFLILMA
jgi:hypothetical protein